MCFKKALILAAGRAAMELAELYAPPPETIAVPIEVADPESIGRFQQKVESLPTDDILLAKWCIDGWRPARKVGSASRMGHSIGGGFRSSSTWKKSLRAYPNNPVQRNVMTPQTR